MIILTLKCSTVKYSIFIILWPIDFSETTTRHATVFQTNVSDSIVMSTAIIRKMNNMIKRYYKFLLLITWMIVIFLLSSEVSGTSSGRSEAIVHILTNNLHVSLPQELLTFITRKAAHTIAYLILGTLIYNVLKEYNFSTRRAILLSISLAFGYACSDEFHQLFVQGRSPEITDVLIDTTASTLGIYIHYLIHKTRKIA